MMNLSPRAVLLTAMLMTGATAFLTFENMAGEAPPEVFVRLEEGDSQSTGDPAIKP